MKRVRQRTTVLLVAMCALVVTGCASAPAIRLPRAGSQTTCVTPRTVRDDVAIGVAFWGGGRRAAMFAAAGLEALGTVQRPDGGSLLEGVSHISSVSGGSLAAAYYGVKKPTRGTPVLRPDGMMTDAYQNFFGEFKAKLTQDFENALLWRQLGSFRFVLNSALWRRARSARSSPTA